ncbi:MAG: hydrogenase maturation protease [Leptolyngbya sp. SIOISBB]|nr:hydrogenase maturation protease [Leptolyngbya sp. SIOISBB]
MKSHAPNTSSSETVTQCRFLIMGYGHEQQGDAAVGCQIVETVAAWRLPSVETLAVRQLTPALVEDIAKADYVILVDACGKSCVHTVQLDPILTSETPLLWDAVQNPSQPCEPSELLSLTQARYGRHPLAWLLEIPAQCFETDHTLSDVAQEGCDRALRIIEQFFTTYLQSPCVRSESCQQSG